MAASSFAEAPDYEGNAALVEATMPPSARHERLAATRSWHPRFLPKYVDEHDDQGNVTKKAADMYAAAIPKVAAAIAVLSAELLMEYSLRFPIRSGQNLLRGHQFEKYGSYQYGDLDPYSEPYQDPDPPKPRGPNQPRPKPNPLKPIFHDPCNKYCGEEMYIVPVLHYSYTDKDGVKHYASSLVNPRTGVPRDGSNKANGGTVKNNCLGLHKNVDNSAGWSRILSAVGPGSCGGDTYPDEGGHERCGAHEQPASHADCVATCISHGRVQKFNGIQGPKFIDVAERVGECGQTINAPTAVRYDLCFTVDQAKQQCITSDIVRGVYGGLSFDFCSCHGYTISQTFGLGDEKNLNPKEDHELCIPYKIPVRYDEHGCPYVPEKESAPMGPTQGQNEGSWDPGNADTYIDFEIKPKSELPSEWFEDDKDDEDKNYVGYDVVAYEAFSASALHRKRKGENQ